MADGKRMIFEGQAVAAAIDVKVAGNIHVTIDRGSYLKKPENCLVPAGTPGLVKAVDDSRILVHFRPQTNAMVALWFAKTILATQLKLFDRLYEG